MPGAGDRMSSREERKPASLGFGRRSAGELVQKGGKREVGKASCRRLTPLGRVVDQERRALGKPRGCRSREAILLPASSPSGDKPSTGTWSESFIFAGGSAFLLLLAILIPNYWYFSFFALTPLLYRIIKATPGECIRLGFLFGLLFFGISVVDSLVVSPLVSVLKLLCGTALFALFGWLLGWARQRWGFNPFIIVFLWVSLELGLVKLGCVGGVLGESGFSQPVFNSLAALFGFLTVSAIIVLLNSLLILAIVKRPKVAGLRHRIVQEDEGILEFFSTFGLFAQRIYFVPESRAPPNLIFQNSNRKSLVDLKCRAGFSRVR
jgi:hypothetical protein